MQVCKPYHYAIVEAVEPIKLHPTFMAYKHEVFEHFQLLCIDIWLHTHSVFITDVSQIWERLPKSLVMQVCKPYHFAMVEAVEHFKLHITSMSYLYEVFEHLQLLCIDIWMHIHSVTTTDISPDLGELAKSLGDASVQTMPLCNGSGCRTFQTASHIHDIPI